MANGNISGHRRRERKGDRQRYQEFVEQGIHASELQFIRGAVQRNQHIGSEALILEVERRTGNANPSSTTRKTR